MGFPSLISIGQPLAGVSAFFGAGAILVGAASTHVMGASPLVDIGLSYHLPHAIMAFVAAIVATRVADTVVAKRLRWAALLWLLGILGFSGGLYLRAFAFVDTGPVVPAGALLMIAAWAAAGRAGWRMARR